MNFGDLRRLQQIMKLLETLKNFENVRRWIEENRESIRELSDEEREYLREKADYDKEEWERLMRQLL